MNPGSPLTGPADPRLPAPGRSAGRGVLHQAALRSTHRRAGDRGGDATLPGIFSARRRDPGFDVELGVAPAAGDRLRPRSRSRHESRGTRREPSTHRIRDARFERKPRTAPRRRGVRRLRIRVSIDYLIRPVEADGPSGPGLHQEWHASMFLRPSKPIWHRGRPVTH